MCKLKRFAQNLNHRFAQNAAQSSLVARVSPFAAASGERQNALVSCLIVVEHHTVRFGERLAGEHIALFNFVILKCVV